MVAGVSPALFEEPVFTVGTAAFTARGPHFLRNERPNPTEYSGERPEMSFSRREIKEGQNKKRKLNNE